MSRINSHYVESQSDIVLLCGEHVESTNIRDRFSDSREITFKATFAFLSDK